jgi:serine/threonine protein kinase
MIPEVVACDARPAGTPQYLAPEMLLDTIVPGHARLLDTYAFGVMAFEMLAGVPPFVAADSHEVMRMHIADRAPDLLPFRADVPVALADLIDACLAKSPSERPATMDEVAWELRAIPPARPAPRSRPRTTTMR